MASLPVKTQFYIYILEAFGSVLEIYGLANKQWCVTHLNNNERHTGCDLFSESGLTYPNEVDQMCACERARALGCHLRTNAPIIGF